MNIVQNVCLIWFIIVAAFNLLWIVLFGAEYFDMVTDGPDGEFGWYLIVGYDLSGLVAGINLLIFLL